MISRLALSGLVLAFGAVAAHAQDTQYPLTVQNCGAALTFDAAPASAVSIGQAATEVLYALDLGPKLTGTAVWFSDVLPAYRAQNDKVPRLADNDPSFESIVAKKPGLVAVQYEWHIGPQGIIGTRDQFHELGIPTYIMPADCVGKDNTVGLDGTRLDMFSTDSLYQGIAELAQIFDVNDRGASLIAGLKTREAKAEADAKALNIKDASAVFWFSSAEMDIDPYVAGRKGAPGYMMDKLGLRNIVESDEEWPTVGWETIAKADPTVIVIARMDRRRFEADDVEKKMAFLKSDPVASQMQAVREGRIVVMDALAMDATVRLIDGLEELASALKSYGLSK